MAQSTDIEWTHVPGYRGETWNPVRGCTKISPGCKNCYAATFAERWRGVAGHPYERGFDLRLVPEALDAPLRAKRPRAYFVNSMSDLHHESVPHEFIRVAYAVMQTTPRHIFMVLTKRAENMRADLHTMIRATTNARRAFTESVPREARLFLPDGTELRRPFIDGVFLPNAWLGVSVENRKHGLPRVDVLRTIPAAVRFLSIEPLLEDLGDVDLTGIDWVIAGGESGPGARQFDLAWVRRLRDQCREQDVPFFLKQLGAAAIDESAYLAGYGLQVAGDAVDMVPLRRLKSRKGADESEWPADLRGLKAWPRVVSGGAR